MPDLVDRIAHNGPAFVALICFLEAIGMPLPAAVALLAGGAFVALGKMPLQPAAAGVVLAFLAADFLMYALGRFTGWWLLGLLCRLSSNQESCILRATRAFHRRGRVVLLFAKFVPGLAALASPLAGSMRMPVREFAGLNAAGILIYVGTYGTLGYLFSDMLAAIASVMLRMGNVAVGAAGAAAAAFLALRLYRTRRTTPVPQSTVAEMRQWMAQEPVLIADARSHGYYDRGALRIQGAVRLDPNELPEALENVPRDRKIFVYCTCTRDATAEKVTRILLDNGFDATVLRGGLSAWRKAGQPVEPAPDNDIRELPSFAR